MRELKITTNITNREAVSVETYFNDISRLPMISPEEEVALAKKIRQGDRAALDRLCTANLRFVVSVAKKYQHQGLPLSDLISEGNLGLIKAAKRFDETRGFKFISFAVWWIRQSIIAAITENARMVRLPMNKIGEISKINKALSAIEQQTLREPTEEQLAEYLGMEPQRVREALSCAPWVNSYDAPLGTEDGYSAIEKSASAEPATDHLLVAEDARQETAFLLAGLSERERIVILFSYGFQTGWEMTPADIGAHLGMGGERVRQIRNEALEKLRKLKLPV